MLKGLLVLGHETLPTGPSFFTRLLICCGALGILTRAHESVSSVWISHGVVGFSERFHARNRLRNGGINAFVIAGIKAKNGSCDARHCLFVGRHTVKNKCSGQIVPIGGKPERLPPAPAKAHDEEFAV